jgi:ribonuclease P protein component
MTGSFPKSARLLSSKQFKFKSHRVIDTELFRFIVNPYGYGRLGISISKKAVRLAVGRNRIKRLLREVFRTDKGLIGERDIHVVGKNLLEHKWRVLRKKDVIKYARQCSTTKQ